MAHLKKEDHFAIIQSNVFLRTYLHVRSASKSSSIKLYFFKEIHQKSRYSVKTDLMAVIEEVYGTNGHNIEFIYDFSESSQSKKSTEFTIDGFHLEFAEAKRASTSA